MGISTFGGGLYRPSKANITRMQISAPAQARGPVLGREGAVPGAESLLLQQMRFGFPSFIEKSAMREQVL